MISDNALAGLKEAGVNIEDPIQLLYVLKKLGPAQFEEMFGAGRLNPVYARGREPLIPTDVFELSKGYVEKYRHMFSNPNSERLLHDRRIFDRLDGCPRTRHNGDSSASGRSRCRDDKFGSRNRLRAG